MDERGAVAFWNVIQHAPRHVFSTKGDRNLLFSLDRKLRFCLDRWKLQRRLQIEKLAAHQQQQSRDCRFAMSIRWTDLNVPQGCCKLCFVVGCVPFVWFTVTPKPAFATAFATGQTCTRMQYRCGVQSRVAAGPCYAYMLVYSRLFLNMLVYTRVFLNAGIY